eukprot:1367677-Amphidinium_carterae.1
MGEAGSPMTVQLKLYRLEIVGSHPALPGGLCYGRGCTKGEKGDLGSGPVVRRWPDNCVSPGQRNWELVRLEVPIPSYDVGVFTQRMDMRKHLIQDASVPLTHKRPGTIRHTRIH